jgi:hypothetical protein
LLGSIILKERIGKRSRQGGLSVSPFLSPTIGVMKRNMTMSKKKRLTTQESNLKELFLKFVEALKYNPDLWDQILEGDEVYWDLLFSEREYSDVFGSFSLKEQLRIAHRLSHHVKLRTSSLKTLRAVFDHHLAQPDPFQSFLESKHPSATEYQLRWLLSRTLAVGGAQDCGHLFAAYVDPMQEIQADHYGWKADVPGLKVKLDCKYPDKTILNQLGMILDQYLLPAYRENPLWAHIYDPAVVQISTKKAKRPIFEITEIAGRCPEDLDDGFSLVVLRINMNAGKEVILYGVELLLKEHLGPRDTEKARRFGNKQIETMELGFEVWQLEDGGKSYEEIAALLDKPLSTIKDHLSRAHKHLTQKERGTIRIRKQEDDICPDCGDKHPFEHDLYIEKDGKKVLRDQFKRGDGNWIEKRGMPHIDDAIGERGEVGRATELGGFGAKHTPSGIVGRDDENVDDPSFYDWAWEHSHWEVTPNTRFDNWGKRTGNTNTCMELRGKKARGFYLHKEDCRKCPHFFFDSMISEAPKTAKDQPLIRCSGKESGRSKNGYIECKFKPSHIRCLDCDQTYPPSTYTTGAIEHSQPHLRSATYTKRSPFPETHPGTGKLVRRAGGYTTSHPEEHELDPPRFVKIDEYMYFYRSGLTREQELEMQAEYIEKHGTAPHCPMEDQRTAFDLVEKEPVKKKINILKWSFLQGQHSLASTLRKDLLEQFLVNQIDQPAKESHQ